MKSNRVVSLAALPILFLVTVVPSIRSQQGGNGNNGGFSRPTMPSSGRMGNERMGDPFPDALNAKVAADQARMRNNERQKRLEQDTQKLLDLANELKAEVDKSSKDTLSLSVIRKAEEIEKLAKSVKERMKG